jgi:ABC-type multidrug transport system ATPase subunit
VTRLEPCLDRRAANLSGGMRQKLAKICTLIHLPDILLLDEPTTGVEPISRQEFWQIVGRLVEERGATVLVSTSYMDEAERCPRIALLHAGRIVAEGTPDEGTPDEVKGRAMGRFARLAAPP